MDDHDKLKESVRLLPDLRQQNASTCNIFKDKNLCTPSKCKVNSKVPISVKTGSTLLNKKRVDRPIKLDDSGDRLGKTNLMVADNAETSKGAVTKKLAFDKLRPSLIPRRKPSQATTIKENFLKNLSNAATKPREPQFLCDSKNVKTVQLLINQDYHPEERIRVTTTARPIPTLGQIYGRTNVIEADRISDWFAEIDAPANSLASNIPPLSPRSTNRASPAENDDNTATRPQVTPESESTFGVPASSYKFYNNPSNWVFSSEDYPTRENESGYRSLSHPDQISESKSKNSVSSITFRCAGNGNSQEYPRGMSSSINSGQSMVQSSKGSKIQEQPTVVLAKLTSVLLTTASHSDKTVSVSESQTNSSSTLKTDCSTEIKHYHYPSTSGCSTQASKNIVHQFNVPSYMDCSSEVLQKTTNFESEGCEFESPSSTIGTRVQGIATQLNMDYVCSTSGDEARDKSEISETTGISEMTEVSEKTSVEDSTRYHYYDEVLTVDKSVKGTDINPSECDHCNNCGKRYKGRYKRRQRYRRFPSCRYKLPRTFSTFRRNLSKCNCTRRLSRVWKKTAERWAMWSAKSPHRIKKYRIMQILETSLAWQDVDVQTNLCIYKEIGTDVTPMEKKSEALSIFPQTSSFICYGNDSENNKKFKYRNNNMGPSMFPFVYSAKTNAIRKLKVQSAPTQNCCDSSRDSRTRVLKTSTKGTQKTETNANLTDSISKRSDLQLEKKESTKHTAALAQNCPISLNDKITDTENANFSMKDSITSTLLHMDELHLMNNSKISQNAFYQNCVLCNDAETEVKFPHAPDIKSSSALTSGIENEMCCRACGTNTELKEHGSMNVMTSNWIRTFNTSETQMSPTASFPLGPVSPAFMSSKNQLKPETNDICTGESELESKSVKNDFTTQVTHLEPSLLFSENKMTSVSSGPMQTISAATSEIERMDTGTHTSNILAVNSSYTNRLRAYLNTGMILNTMLQRAVVDETPKISTCTDTKSIGNKYTSDIGTCTNTILNDLAIETEREISAPRFSVNTNTFLEKESKFTEQDGAYAVCSIKQNRSEIGTQYSDVYDKGSVEPLLPAVRDRIGESCLISVRSLANSMSQAAQTEITICDDDKTRLQQISRMRASKNSSSNLNTSYSLNDQVLSNLDAEKWIKAGIEKAYRPLIQIKRAATSKDSDGRHNINSSDLTSPSVYQTSDETSCQHNNHMSKKLINQISDQKIDQRGSRNQISQQLSHQRSERFNNEISVHANRQTSDRDSNRICVEPISQHSTHIIVKSSNEKNTRSCDSGTQSDHTSFQPKQLVTSGIKSSHRTIKSKSSDSSTTTFSVSSKKLESQHSIKSLDNSGNNIVVQQRNSQLGEISKSEFLSLVPEDNKGSIGEGPARSANKAIYSGESNQIQHESCSILKNVQEPDDNKKDEPKSVLGDLAEIQPSVNHMFLQKVNNAIIDVTYTKELKEIDLQASPECSDAATECLQENQPKSASVLTSRCILPCLSHCVCEHHKSGNLSGDCLFVYDKPHCIVHNIKQKTSHVSGASQPRPNKPCTQVQSVGINVNTYFRSQSRISAAFSKHKIEASKECLQKEALSRMSNSFRNYSNTSARSMPENDGDKATESKQSFPVPVLNQVHVSDTFESQSAISTGSTRQKTAASSKQSIQKSGLDEFNNNGLQSQSITSTGSRRQNEAVFSKLSLQKSDTNKTHDNGYFKSQSIMSTDSLRQNGAQSSFQSLEKDAFDKTEKTVSEDKVAEKSSVHFGIPETVVEKCGVHSIGINVKSCKCHSNTTAGCVNKASKELCKLCYPAETPNKTMIQLENARAGEKTSDEDSVRDSDDFGAVQTAVEIMIKAQLQPPDVVVPPAKKSVVVTTTKSVCPGSPAGTQVTKSAVVAMLKGKVHSVEVMAVPMVQSANITTSRYFHQTFPEETNTIESEQGSSYSNSQVLDVITVKKIYRKNEAEEFKKGKVEEEVSLDKKEKEDSEAKLNKGQSKIKPEEDDSKIQLRENKIEKEQDIKTILIKEDMGKEEDGNNISEKREKVMRSSDQSLKIINTKPSKEDNKDVYLAVSSGRNFASSKLEVDSRTAMKDSKKSTHKYKLAEHKPLRISLINTSKEDKTIAKIDSAKPAAPVRSSNRSDRTLCASENRSVQMRVSHKSGVIAPLKQLKSIKVCKCAHETNTVETQVTKFEYDTITKYSEPEHTVESKERAIILCNLADAEAATLMRAEMHSAAMLAAPLLQSAAAMTSRCLCRTYTAETQVSYPDTIGGRKHLATSYRYYTALLTKHLDQVMENFANHFAQPSEASHLAGLLYAEACTMKPSARNELACQTSGSSSKDKMSLDSDIRHESHKMRHSVLDPSISLTDICRNDKEHLNSVYYMLTAIEGRLRRFKTGIDNYQ